MDPVYVVGNFPPPVTGQALATQRLARLLEQRFAVTPVDTSSGAAHVQAEVRFDARKVRHYAGLRRRLRDALAEAPEAPVLWANISPAPLGHLRDVLTVLPTFQPGQRVYGVVHWGDFDRVFRHVLTAPTARRLVRRLSGLVFLNAQLAERCAPWVPAAKRFVVPNTLDDAVRCDEAEIAAKQAARQERAALRLLFLSNMIPEKGYLDVLHAARLLHTRGLAFRADFVGGWLSEADQAAFEQFVEVEGLREVVCHHGAIRDRAAIKKLHLEADVFLLPTYYPTEAQPVSIIEALNAGTPVVTTRHAGIPEMVRDGEEAIFVPPRAPEALADALARLAAYDAWRPFSERARQRFLTHFSPATVRRQWEGLLEEGKGA